MHEYHDRNLAEVWPQLPELSARSVRRMCVEGQMDMAATESPDGKQRIVKQRQVGLKDARKLEAQ